MKLVCSNSCIHCNNSIGEVFFTAGVQQCSVFTVAARVLQWIAVIRPGRSTTWINVLSRRWWWTIKLLLITDPLLFLNVRPKWLMCCRHSHTHTNSGSKHWGESVCWCVKPCDSVIISVSVSWWNAQFSFSLSRSGWAPPPDIYKKRSST